MPLKNLMVHLTQSERTPYRLEVAVARARKHNARLVGVFGQLGKAQRIGIVATWPSDEYRQAAEASKAKFQEATAGLRDTEWVDINRGSESQVTEEVVRHARCFDLVVMGQYREPGMSFAPPDICEEVVVNSGRPVLIIPYIGTYSAVGTRPMMAWTSSREAARALNDALPLVEGCEEMVLFSVDSGHAAPHAEIAKHLSVHGVRTRSEIEVIDEEIGIMDVMLNRTSDLGIDLLVMGANQVERRPFATQGAGTRYILRHMTVPVLMSN
jgi:nucleotide-binding universal stress UspA family protein